MKLYEFEGHEILAKTGIQSPFFVVCESLDEVIQARKRLKFPIVAKVQTLYGRRGKSGGIKKINNQKQLIAFAKQMFGTRLQNEIVKYISVAQYVDIAQEYYISITYDTKLKMPVLVYSDYGGMDIDEVKKTDPDKILRIGIDPIVGPNQKEISKVFKNNTSIAQFILRLWDVFSRFDCRLVEVNPLAKVTNELMAVDAKIILDDSALSRHKDLEVMPKGAISAIPTDREVMAGKIDEDDYRGSAGTTFIELDGDIAVLASGGGASLLLMDSLIAAGGRAANYTEYSGNPPAEKVQKLTEITLSKSGISGCIVAGAVANFTDIYETLTGFVLGLVKIKPKPKYPIVVRRGGPRQPEAYKMLEKFARTKNFDIHLLGPEIPISEASKKIVELSQEYKKIYGNSN
ncbi:hypothetical protein A3A48_02305 [Candidatus Curtissbacteria bacterium RIFCSPLOWO2_01_FULL_37_9]|uniref:ATP-grasp domain-containing protein n=1 Tax=Candidatus Curtissbacteria bacterium RIFCSPLOWO2_01_FULL_37_9 TaxID=1797724 RepID=A0A1F5GS76_9BACT|nr:MAG: hypothetical protein A3A48_02305 [Candidatus Curtissbacteria bacterium RIFCSPLOWO2_01_FULL_37_9]